jgi:RimJ/RimL family protein N-acetyltransferase
MFPLITRDDVFRIETSRLWLRWPEAGDGAALRAFASCAEVALMTASIPHAYPAGEEQRAIAAIRAGNRRGDRLELLIERKNPQRDVIGTVLVRAEQERDPYLGYALHPDHWGQGYASEAAKALVETVFLLTDAQRLAATVQVGNQASCHVLEKLGFALQGERTHFSALRNAAQPLADYGLTRTAYHARFGGALYPLHWTVPYNSHEWIGAA